MHQMDCGFDSQLGHVPTLHVWPRPGQVWGGGATDGLFLFHINITLSLSLPSSPFSKINEDFKKKEPTQFIHWRGEMSM